MKIVYIARHGETDANKAMRFQGHTDNPLNAKGHAQAEELASRVANLHLAKIYASDLTRAVQTATPMAKDHNLPIVSLPDFREICFGKWEGLTFNEIKAQWPSSIDLFLEKPKEARIENGESFPEVQKRAWDALQEIVEEQAEDTSIMLVAHGGIVRVLLCAALNLDLNKMWTFYVDNASLTCLIKWEDKYLLKFHNYVGKI
ncbi:MAG: alpha-ribazole phosphatase [Acidaminococcaceae bacterium]|nr:alpha-ribazole phosphatase [Acidaminococcaceae bacterium]MDD4723015.1 alpha-ribazole phosphatase [Acidaminococcaceae bacterium]